MKFRATIQNAAAAAREPVPATVGSTWNIKNAVTDAMGWRIRPLAFFVSPRTGNGSGHFCLGQKCPWKI